MRWRLSVSLLLVFAAGCSKSPRQYVDLGNKLFDAHKYEDASLNYRKAIQKDPSLADAYYGLGKALLEQRKVGDAYVALTRAVELAPQNLDAKQRLANLALAAYLGDRRRPKNLYDQLNKLAGQFLARDPNSYDGLRLKGYIALGDNQRDEAIGDFRKALQAKSTDPEMTLTLAGILFQDQATAGEGEKMVLDLIQKRKETGAAYDLMYRYYSETKRPADAENILKAKVSANPKEAAYVLQLAGHYRRAGKTQDMKATLDVLLNDPKTFPKGRMLAGDFYAQTGDREQALKYYEEGARSSQGDDLLVYQKREVSTLTLLGRSDRALAQLQESLQAHPKDAELHLARGLILLDQRKPDPAIEELQGLDKEQKDNPIVKYHLGRALLLKGRSKEAAAAWQDAVRVRPNYLEPKIALASYALDLRNFDEALRQADQIISTAPGDLRAQLLRAGALQGLNRPAEAEVLLTDLRKQFPGNPAVETEMAFLHLRQNKPAEAEKIFRAQYTPGQENLRPLTGLAETLLIQKKGDEALRLLQADLAKAPGRPQVQFMLANSFVLTGQRDAALQTLEQLVAAHPENAQAYLSLGQLQARKGDLEAALASFQKAHDAAQQSPQPLLLLAETADRMGRWRPRSVSPPAIPVARPATR